MSPEKPRSASAARTQTTKAVRLPRERTHFKELWLANHFGTIPGSQLKAGAKPTGNTTYEQLMCVGYQPALHRLDAVVNVKLNNGYGGGLCSNGSREYVKFFISTDGGVIWEPKGTVSFPVWDTATPKPLEYVATLFGVELDETCCRRENLVQVRAILSWEVPPAGPDDPVVWGNALDATIQVAPITKGNIFDLFHCLKLEIDKVALTAVVDPYQPIAFGVPKKLGPIELHQAYARAKVEPHRYLFPHVAELLAQPTALAPKLLAPEYEIFKELKVDISKVVAVLLDPQGNETYESLGCVGLNELTNELVATINVKLPSGYSGNLCTDGSKEYVAFWVDWQDGAGFQHAGTTSVTVHDIASIPPGGLKYSAALPYPHILNHRQPCNRGPVTAVVRAVLSWATPPSSTDPFAVPVWGGHAQTRILVPPGEGFGQGGPLFEWIGSMPVGDISNIDGKATGDSILGWHTAASPFGGRVAIAGHVINPATSLPGGPGYQYRLGISYDGGASWSWLTAAVHVTVMALPSGIQSHLVLTPDPQGWTSYVANFSGGSLQQIVGDVLGYYNSLGNGQVIIRLEARDAAANPLGTVIKMIQLDNERPVSNVSVTSGGGSCGEFKQGDIILGAWDTTDNDAIGSIAISLEPFGIGPALTTVSITPNHRDGTWELDTGHPLLKPCGYVVRFDGYDRTIVDSGRVGWDGPAFTGFCLKA